MFGICQYMVTLTDDLHGCPTGIHTARKLTKVQAKKTREIKQFNVTKKKL